MVVHTDITLNENQKRKVKKSPKRTNKKANGLSSQRDRKWVQFGFLTVIIWIGVEFVLFVHQLESGLTPSVSRPPGVEGLLPISALISLKYWLLTGIFNQVHPSGLVIFMIILFTGFALKKGFCSWVCSFGLLSEYLSKVHTALFDKIIDIPRWIDYPLRSLKYLLLLFFAWAVLLGMDVIQLEKFIYSPYNKVADIKMLKFFTEISETTIWTLAILVFLSVLVPYFWCRYLCPYGALLGALSWLSPFKIHRDENRCIHCDKCTQVCPARINVHKENVVLSDECHACLQCVDACPVNDTLHFSVLKTKFKLPRIAYTVIIVGLFLFGSGLARITGYWQNNISTSEYKDHIQHLEKYHHNQSDVPDYETKEFQTEKKQNNHTREGGQS